MEGYPDAECGTEAQHFADRRFRHVPLVFVVGVLLYS